MAIWDSLKDKAKKLADEASEATKGIVSNTTEIAKGIAEGIDKGRRQGWEK